MKNMKEDNIDERIERVIRSVAAKKKDINMWESERTNFGSGNSALKKRWIISSAAAAVLITLVGVSYLRHVTYSNERELSRSMSEDEGDLESIVDIYYGNPVFRGGERDITEIEIMIKECQYEDALLAINTALADTVIDAEMSQERYDYQRNLIDLQNYELTWLKITTLLKLGKTEEAVALLKDYVNETGDHQIDAQNLLNKLRK